MIAGTGLPKYQVEQAAKVVAGRVRGTIESHGIRRAAVLLSLGDAQHGPRLRAFRSAVLEKLHPRGGHRVLSFLFKIWIVAMLVGYFVAFVALGVLAIVASVAASAAGRGGA